MVVRIAFLSALALLVISGCDGRCGRRASSGPQPAAVVLVTIDTLRADAVSFAAGGGPDTTPFLASLAADGIVFDAAYAPSSWTAPSMASLFTALEPKSHGVVRGAIAKQDGDGPAAVNQRVLPASLTTLAESFQAAGYRTIGVAANSHLAADLGFGQGFDWYLDEAPFVDADVVNRHVFAALAAEIGSDWRETWKQRPTFLWIHYFDPHAPYEAREPWVDELTRDGAPAPRDAAGLSFPDLIARYREPSATARQELEPLYLSEVRWVDEHLRALDAELGFSDPDVLLLVTSDHGEEFGEHGGLGHGQTLYEEQVRVPMFVRWPAQLPRGARAAAPVSLIDVFPTLAKLLALDVPESAHGVAVPLDRLDSLPLERPIFLETMRTRPRTRAVRAGDDKLVLRDFRHRTMRDRRRELYDLATDPGEQQNLAEGRTARASELETEIQRHSARLPKAPRDARDAPVADEATVERLRQLGYGD